LLGFGEPIAEEGSVLQILSVAVYNHYKRIYFESSRKGNVKQSNSGHGYFFFIFLFLRDLILPDIWWNLWKKTKKKKISFILLGFGEPIAEEGSVLQILSVVPGKKSLEEDKENSCQKSEAYCTEKKLTERQKNRDHSLACQSLRNCGCAFKSAEKKSAVKL
jgi:hypothetical protein